MANKTIEQFIQEKGCKGCDYINETGACLEELIGKCKEDDIDCLACENSQITDVDDRLWCTLHEKIVKVDRICEDFN